MKKKLKFTVFTAIFFAVCLFSTPSRAMFFNCWAEETYTTSKAECVMEMNSRRILYESHGDVRLPMASTTKIVTCATVLELCKDLQEEIVIPPEAAGVEGSSVYLKSGDVYTVEELLYGLMLRSGNDCATALALHTSGSVADFSAKMNRTAQKAGALASNFENPHGLPCKDHYTTARDLTTITCYAMQNAQFRKIVSTQYYEPRHWKNKNKMLQTCEGAIGVKTGYTKEAGRCLVSAAERNGMTLVCTVLSCAGMYERSTSLLNDAFGLYENCRLLGAEEIIEITGDNNKVRGVAKTDVYYPLLKEEKELIEIRTRPYKPLKNTEKNKEIVGQFEIYLSKRLLFSGNLYKL